MSQDSSSQRLEANARPARLTPSGPGNISGNRVSTVARQGEGTVMAAGYGITGERSRPTMGRVALR